MLTVDLRRAVSLHPVEDIDAPDVAPGDVEVRIIDGVVWGYAFACPGCGGRSYLALGDLDPGPRRVYAVVEVLPPPSAARDGGVR